LRDGFKSEGELNFLGATIGRNLECNGAQLTNPKGKALNADGAKIDGSVFLRNGFKSEGEVNFIIATIGGTLDCDQDSHFSNPDGIALNADGAKINGSVFLRNGFTADGGVEFINSELKGFQWYQTRPSKGTWLDLRLMKVATLLDDESGWPREGNLFLDGFTYDRIEDHAPKDAVSRIRWLHRQSHNTMHTQPYEQLALVLRNMGLEREARKVMIEKNRDQANFTKAFSHGWWWYNVFGRLIGYGYAPSRAFFISLGMIALGGLLFHLCYVRNIITPTDERGYMKDSAGQIILENGRRRFSEEYPKFNAFVYSLESFTPLLKLDQSESWTPNANRGVSIHFLGLHFTTGSLVRAYLWFHIVAGWVLTSLWVGGITGLVKS
jgi:sRNA-binding regulator protein Hfq